MDMPQHSAMQFRAAVGAQEPMSWIEVNGAKLAVMRRGQGTPVICLHAIGHGARDFETLAEFLSDSFEIIALDWPAQGWSQDDGRAPTAANYELTLEAALDALDLERVILLGNSIGGATALRLAANRPERVKALVLCNAGGLLKITPFVRF